MKLFEKLKTTLTKTREKILVKFSKKETNEETIDQNFYDDLEEVLIEADVGMTTTIQIVEQLKLSVKKEKLKLKDQAKEQLVLIVDKILDQELNNDELFSDGGGLKTILMLGVNGVGKTTSIAKLAYWLKCKNKKVVIAAADTFRAAAVEQLSIWSNRIDCTLISHGQDCDPAAVVYDAVIAAKKLNADYVICDTAGRLHNKKNLMMQLEKMVRVAKKESIEPVVNLLAIDSTLGQNSLSQVEEFKKIAVVNGIVLTKLDGTAKGGIAIAIANEKQVPIKFLGTGEQIDDFCEFDSKNFAKALFE